MLEHYHNINSVCAQKVRIALAEKGLEVKEHLLTLRGDQHDPAYRKLNPNGVVPTLVHDGRPIIESSLILYYLDDAFPEPPLMPREPLLRHRVRLYNKLVDEYVHNSCMILTFATAFRPNFIKMPREAWLAEINKTPLKRRAEGPGRRHRQVPELASRAGTRDRHAGQRRPAAVEAHPHRQPASGLRRPEGTQLEQSWIEPSAEIRDCVRRNFRGQAAQFQA